MKGDRHVGCERRLVRLFVPSQLLMRCLFLETGRDAEYVARIRAPGLPDDVCVHGVSADFERNGAVFLLEHPSFEPVPEGSRPPEILLEYRVCRVARLEEVDP